jgi:CNP1-like family
MKFKPVFLTFLTSGALALGLNGIAGAQILVDNPDWKESEVPAPPAFDVGKLVTFEVSSGSSLVYGVDPASIRITQSDGVVRYVMVATSASGAKNVMYEGLRCATAEFKTYARYSSDGRWSPVSNPEWRSLFGSMPSKHALRFAQAGGCDNASAPASVKVMVSRLKNPNFKVTE